ncbi:unnamed protein product [Didymodactylos carnosus]|uniref:Ubiquitin-like domain-containing protein n=1 Tax=Didymodactylos carnosus TaxID=1234261 RepID=A0A815F7N3_9BILA|nr:unnamed protein product [Didymodactylos carnosus]CAF1322596.1 unnamed protein product [Didymodactylos carnosus]CAF3952102.1 unnamed protein product [Didymodactylos carnosus]CAF4169816.1 unnamed protein product [Didymodactylos carnosus]
MASSSTTADQVQVTITRKSDGKSMVFNLAEKATVKELKTELKARLTPQYAEGCRLIYKGKVLKGKHSLKHYGLKAAAGGTDIIMDDSKDWKSSSDSSDSEKEHK